MEYLWEAKGHEKLVENLKAAPEVIALHLNRALRKASHILVPYLKSKTPVGATHHLRNYTVGQIQILADGQRLEIRQAAQSRKGFPYGVAVREGTRPHFPPYRELIPWVNAVLGVQGKRANSVAFLIARKISKYGTRPNPYHADLISTNQSAIQSIVDDEGVQILGQLSGKAGA